MIHTPGALVITINVVNYHYISYLGGLEAVTYTDVLQCSIMLIGAVVLTILGNIIVSFFISLLFNITKYLETKQKALLDRNRFQ